MALRACLFMEPLMIDLTSAPATQNPSSPMMVWTTTMAVVTAATDGGLLLPLRECAMGSANAQNGTIHMRMRNTSVAATGTPEPVSCPRSRTIHRACRFSTSLREPWARALALDGGGANLLPREYGTGGALGPNLLGSATVRNATVAGRNVPTDRAQGSGPLGSASTARRWMASR
jgi:hypothetical protein